MQTIYNNTRVQKLGAEILGSKAAYSYSNGAVLEYKLLQ